MTQQVRTPIDAHAIEAVVKEQFDFLLSAGYKVTSARPDEVWLSNGELSIVLDIEPGSYVVMSDIRRASTNERYSFYEVLFDLVPTAAQEVSCNGRDIEAFRRCLQRLSALCRQHLHPMLMGDEEAFAKIATAARAVRHKYNLKLQYGSILARANKAWEEKNWEKARELYESAKLALSTIEENRLKFLLSGR